MRGGGTTFAFPMLASRTLLSQFRFWPVTCFECTVAICSVSASRRDAVVYVCPAVRQQFSPGMVRLLSL